jgi:hypothetical protein
MGQTLQHAVQLAERFDAVHLAGTDKAEVDGGRVAAALAAHHTPILTADGDASMAALGLIVVGIQESTARKFIQRFPLIERVAVRVGEVGLGEHIAADLPQLGPEHVQQRFGLARPHLHHAICALVDREPCPVVAPVLPQLLLYGVQRLDVRQRDVREPVGGDCLLEVFARMLSTTHLKDRDAGIQVDAVVAIVGVGLELSAIVVQERGRMRALLRHRELVHRQPLPLIADIVPEPRSRPLARFRILALHGRVDSVQHPG